MCLDVPAGGEPRFFAVPPDMLDRMAMVGLQARLRPYRFERFGEAWGVIREGRGDMEARALTCCSNGSAASPFSDAASWVSSMRSCASWTTITPWSVPSGEEPLRRHLLGWDERKPLLQHLLGGGHMCANGIDPAFD